jgi:CBS-domain-containing membrane protein
MTEGVVFLRASDSQEKAWQDLRANGVTGAPVLGEQGRLVGIITLTDLADPRRRKPETSGTVEDAMTRIVYAVRANDAAMVAVHLMIQEDIHRAVVVNDDGTIAGIVAPMDILRALARGVDLRDSSVAGSKVEYVDMGGIPK